MREIKFRAWHNKEKKMYHDVYLLGVGIWTSFLDKENDFRIIGTLLEDIVLEQFTGLKDKNGKEIYEGDIVEHEQKPHKWHYLITNEHDEYFGIFAKCIYRNFDAHRDEYDDVEYDFGDFYNTNEVFEFVYIDSKEYVVIGNIHEENK